MTYSLATTLDDTFRACNPDSPLIAKDERYVDLTEIRGAQKVITDSVMRCIKRSALGEYYRLLFTGHRGSGKSTELLRLQEALQREKFFAIYLDVENVLDLSDINYQDVLVAITRQIEVSLRENNMPLPDALGEDISAWFAEKIIERQQANELNASMKTSAETGATVPFLAKLLALFTAEVKAASSRRVMTRQNLERELVVFVEKLNLLIAAARRNVKKQGFHDLVLIVDGLEKMHYTVNKEGISSHKALFVEHAEQLKAPECHIIYTMPVSLAYNANLGSDYSKVEVLPMVKTSEEGIAKLLEVVAKRVDINQVFASRDLLEQLAKLSGGVIRDLMRLVRMATDSDAAQIQQADVDCAMQTLIREYDRLLRTDDIKDLLWVKQHKRAQADAVHERLLNLRLILEYQNGERWADLHPALEKISWVREALKQG